MNGTELAKQWGEIVAHIENGMYVLESIWLEVQKDTPGGKAFQRYLPQLYDDLVDHFVHDDISLTPECKAQPGATV